MNIFIQISLIIVLVSVVSGVMRFLKQPLIIGYILTGLILAPFLLQHPESIHTVETFSEMGIAILLFIVGLHLSPKEAKSFGATALKIGLAQIIATSGLGYLLAKALGFALIPSIYIAIGLTFSSTIIVLKLLSDKKELEKLYGHVAIAVLLLQDIVAALVLIGAAATSNGDAGIMSFFLPLLKGTAIAIVAFYISAKVFPKVDSFFARSQEFLFLFSLGWGFGIAALFSFLGLSVEIGALVAGVALSVSPYATEISTRLRPLRDFFVVMFFIFIGSQLDISTIPTLWFPVLVLSAFILIGKPLIIMITSGVVGHSKRTGFLSGTSLAQISEFSLILGLLGLKLGHIDENVMSLLTILGVVSIGISTYLIMYSERIYPRIAKYLKIFERKRTVKEFDLLSSYEVILFGCNRVGYDFIESFKHLGQKFLCVDFDPDVVKDLTAAGINCRYGDAEDGEFLNEINFDEAKMIVSTIPDFEANMFLLDHIDDPNKVIMVLLSYNVDNALDLYEKGSDYVIMPHFIGGRLVAEMAEEVGFDDAKFNEEKTRHIEYLEKRRELGHEHPKLTY